MFSLCVYVCACVYLCVCVYACWFPQPTAATRQSWICCSGNWIPGVVVI